MLTRGTVPYVTMPPREKYSPSSFVSGDGKLFKEV